jgi:hypothetical protein
MPGGVHHAQPCGAVAPQRVEEFVDSTGVRTGDRPREDEPPLDLHRRLVLGHGFERGPGGGQQRLDEAGIVLVRGAVVHAAMLRAAYRVS